jgi:hypothetical protein
VLRFVAVCGFSPGTQHTSRLPAPTLSPVQNHGQASWIRAAILQFKHNRPCAGVTLSGSVCVRARTSSHWMILLGSRTTAARSQDLDRPPDATSS